MIYDRLEALIGEAALKKLNDTYVSVIGLGAVGYTVCEALLRSGIVNLRIIDHDIVKETNFNRQLLALESTLGQKKAAVAKKRLLDINKNANIEAIDGFFHVETADEILKPPLDFVVDAIDSLNPKFNLILELLKRNIRFISSMGAARKLDSFKIKYGNITDATNCPLAKMIRKRLRKKGITTGIKCVYSEEKPVEIKIPQIEEEDYYKRGRNRIPIGSIATVTGVFGNTIAACLIDEILKI